MIGQLMLWFEFILYKIVLLRFFVYTIWNKYEFPNFAYVSYCQQNRQLQCVGLWKNLWFSVIQNHFRRNVIAFLLYQFFDLMFNPHLIGYLWVSWIIVLYEWVVFIALAYTETAFLPANQNWMVFLRELLTLW